MDWSKFQKVFTLDVDVQVKKEVTRADVILSLLEENEIAFKGKNGTTLVVKLKDGWDIATLRKIIYENIEDNLVVKKDLENKELLDKDYDKQPTWEEIEGNDIGK